MEGSLSIVMPAYNEEHSIVGAVREMLSTMQELSVESELIVVDDRSTDATGGLVDELAADDSRVAVIHHDKNGGIGAAFKSGLRRARYDVVMLVPVDSPLQPSEIELYLSPISTFDVVVGVRAERVGYTFFALVCSRIYSTILVPLFFNLGIADVNWIQAYRRQIFDYGKVEIRSNSIFFFVEILVAARDLGFEITEVPSPMKRRLVGKPSSSKVSVMWQTMVDLLCFFIRQRFKGAKTS